MTDTTAAQPPSWAELIRRKRGQLGITQAALADLLGVTRPAVCYWETDAVRPNQDHMRALVQALDITAEELAAVYASETAA